MRIKDFMKLLENYNPDADITLINSEDITVSHICRDYKTGKRLTPKTTLQCFIEGIDKRPNCVHEYEENDARMCNAYHKPCYDVNDCNCFEEVE